MRFTTLLVVAFAAIAFAKPHPRKDSSSEEDRKHKGPYKHHGHHHHRRTIRSRPTTPQSVTTSAMPEEGTELPAITTIAADKVVTDTPVVPSTKESIITPAEPQPSTDLPDITSSPADVAVSDAVTARVTAGQMAITIGDFDIPIEGVLP
ncbi:unnamed protein product [Strongylus vulgaris]|uniref:Uncharacterized protein n=1 Tax=Strongylus vulgaris TaxID=40348 RepID=A0A3P7LPC3_STRVU|nr:unnamed protein product [Strongylus vulgaris]